MLRLRRMKPRVLFAIPVILLMRASHLIFIADANSKILDYLDVIQRMAMQGVWEGNFALMGMELHHPSVFPLFEPTQVAL